MPIELAQANSMFSIQSIDPLASGRSDEQKSFEAPTEPGNVTPLKDALNLIPDDASYREVVN